jgi:hypothetical protein
MTTSERVNKLKEAMQGMSAPASTAPVVAAAAQPMPAPTPRQVAPSRSGKRNVSAYVKPEAARQLRMLAVELDISSQDLIAEALNDLFRKYNKSAVA